MRQIHGVALAALCALHAAPAAWAAPRFHAQDPGTAWVDGSGSALDGRGDVAGTIVDPASGQTHDLGTLAGAGTSHASVAHGINDQ